MCSGTTPNPLYWNLQLHKLVGCDHDSVMARKLDAFLEDFMLDHHYNRRAKDEPLPRVTVKPLPPIFTRQPQPLESFEHITRRMREDAAKEPRGETITFGPASSINFPAGCHKPDFLDFAKGGLITSPEVTFGGLPVAPPIDLPPVEANPECAACPLSGVHGGCVEGS